MKYRLGDQSNKWILTDQPQVLNPWVAVLFCLGLAVTALIYWPGLSGSFIFDDYPNLTALGAKGGINDWTSLKQYVLSGFAGPTGRPVALLSFLLDANTWPASPEPFKYTNICLHLLNGCLLFLVVYRLLALYEGQNEPGVNSRWVALIVALAWLFQPYLVSTTLYVVQRMAMLAMLFTFAGIYVWLKVRPVVAERPRFAYGWMTFALVVPGLLGVFSKENAAVLPVLILVIESTVIAASGLPELNRWWRRVFLVAPTLLILGYLAFHASRNGWFVEYPGRDFSPVERLLTQARILFVYVYNWFVPQLHTTGLFNDNIVVSTSLFRPITTLPAVLALVAVVAASVRWRRQWPLVSMAGLFFLASQLVESTTVGLELMYEHRVYLASGLLLLPVFHGLLTVYPRGRVLLASLAYLALLALFCWQNASLWGDYRTMVATWAEKAPDSPRAQVEKAKMLFEGGRERTAVTTLNRAAKRLPDDFFLRSTQVLVQCRVSQAGEQAKRELVDLAGRVEYRATWFNTMQKFMEWSSKDSCANIDIAYFERVIDAFLAQPRNRTEGTRAYAQLQYMKGVALLIQDSDARAIARFQRSLQARDGVQKLMNMGAYLATFGYHEQALALGRRARAKLASGELQGRELAEAPSIEEVQNFINTVKRDMGKE